jgi:hypothetical protein
MDAHRRNCLVCASRQASTSPTDVTARRRLSRSRPARPADRARRAGELVGPLEGRVLFSTFTVTNTLDAGPGSLRQAILDAEAATPFGVDTIAFAIPGPGAGGVHTIRPLSPLPALTQQTTLDATTQPGYAGTPRIEIDGSSAGAGADGLVVDVDIVRYDAPVAVVRGLAVGNFSGAGIRIDCLGARLAANHIGADASGTRAAPNGVGVHVTAGYDGGHVNQIGTAAPADRNVISGNRTHGLLVGRGVDAAGRDPGYNRVAGNYIGTAADGAAPLGNGGDGVRIADGAAAAVGFDPLYTVTGTENVIAHNGGSGVAVLGAAGPNFAGLNSIHSNGGLGIDLGADGVTPNDPLDADAGPNGLTNYPELTFAQSGFNGLQVRGTIRARPNTRYHLTFFASPAADPSGFGEGRDFVATSGTPFTDDNGLASFSVNQTSSQFPDLAGQFLTATASAVSNNGVIEPFEGVSEFSRAVRVAARAPLVVTNTNDAGPGSLRQAILSANVASDSDGIVFNIPGAAGAVRTIEPLTPLPTVTWPAVIDATTQPGYAEAGGRPVVELSGARAGAGAAGLTLRSFESHVRGFAINRFGRAGVLVLGSGSVLRSNFIGTDPSGSAALPNGVGVEVEGGSATIGGSTPAARNVISGNRREGVRISPDAADPANVRPTGANGIYGNYIGLDAAGSAALGNGGAGVLIDGEGFGDRSNSQAGFDFVGGDAPTQRNVIAANGGAGVEIRGNARYVNVRGNYVGTDAAGALDLGNAGAGVLIDRAHAALVGAKFSGVAGGGSRLFGAPNLISGNGGDGVRIAGNGPAGVGRHEVKSNVIGLSAAGAALGNGGAGVSIVDAADNDVGSRAAAVGGVGEGNTIAHNGGAGVSVTGGDAAVGNDVAGNSIFANAGLGIDLGPVGVTPDDADDLDEGPNHLQNAPVLRAVGRTADGRTVVQFTLNTRPNFFVYRYRVDIFASPPADADPSGRGEGRNYVGSVDVTVGDGNGFTTSADSTHAVATAVLAAAVPDGHLVTATATETSVTPNGGDALGGTSEFSAPVAAGGAAVANREVFYNRSPFDGNNAAANAADDNAVAPDKEPLLPDQKASFLNYTSYSRGINGIMVDVAGLPAGVILTAADFEFRVGNDDSPGDWAVAPAPQSVTRRDGAGASGSDRFTIVWQDGAIKKQWLQVTVKATANTRLATPDVFDYGNAVGESLNKLPWHGPADARVTSADELGARAHPRTSRNPAPIDYPWDYNRDRLVNISDQLIARNNKTTTANDLNLIKVPPPSDSAAAVAQARPRPVSAGRPGAQSWPAPAAPAGAVESLEELE